MSKNSGFKSIAVNATFLSSARLVTSAVRAFYAVFLAGFIGDELYGLFNYGLSWYIFFIPVSTLGLDLILVREVGLDHAKSASISGRLFLLRIISSVFFSLLCLILALMLEPERKFQPLLVIFAFAIFGRGMSLWGNAVLRAHEKSGFVFGLEIIFRVLEITVGLSLLYFGHGIYTLAIVHTSIWLLQSIASFLFIYFYLTPLSLELRPGAAWGYIKKGIPFIISAIMTSFFLQGPILIFRHLKGVGPALGQLTLALQFFFILGGVLNEVGEAALPVLSRSVVRQDDGINRYLKVILVGGLLLGGFLIISAVAVGHEVFSLFFGNAYNGAANLLPFSVALVIPYFWATSINTTIIAHGRYWKTTLIEAGGALALGLVLPVSISYYNELGVFFALSARLLFIFTIQLCLFYPPNSLPITDLVKVFTSVLLGAGISVWLKPYNAGVSLFAGLITLIVLSLASGSIRPRKGLDILKRLVR